MRNILIITKKENLLQVLWKDALKTTLKFFNKMYTEIHVAKIRISSLQMSLCSILNHAEGQSQGREGGTDCVKQLHFHGVVANSYTIKSFPMIT